MKTKYVFTLSALLGAQLVSVALADDQPAAEPTFKDSKEKASYAIGLNIGSNLKRAHLDIDLDTMMKAIKDTQSGVEPKLTPQQAGEAINAYQQEARKMAAEKNEKAGEAFLAANKNKEGVKILSATTPDGKASELQYKIITEGTGATPTSTDTVKVNYRGTLIDGTEFDSSYKRGQPAQFPVTGVIRGWTEALQHMKVGSKWQLFIPANLAYAERGSGAIEPGSTLIFEVELLEIEAPKAAAEPQPQPAATSDIIRVPSAEEMKKGAKPEVIKAADVQKLMTNGTNAGSAAKK